MMDRFITQISLPVLRIFWNWTKVSRGADCKPFSLDNSRDKWQVQMT